MPTLFRADKRHFSIGEALTTAGEFIQKHPEDGRLAEQLLEYTRPELKPKRGDCLMLFENEKCARDHWSKMTAGKLYRVSISEQSILHRGDMHLVNEIARRLLKGDQAEDLAHAYWRGETASEHCVEILVSSGTIEAELGSEAERVEHFKRLIGFKK